ncbi:hypothetical protein LOK49_LG09G02823 [Camellia lanceoleosa]|uniref:Uncharacterized protein n=1 Tax=Camellia lanceoleosa TaxID=1840588 RepID=A0ACC0GK12_9ERIC|nr:hypothetical protein LOK49_LG09G02823 [Camellia lanceoleosa]
MSSLPLPLPLALLLSYAADYTPSNGDASSRPFFAQRIVSSADHDPLFGHRLASALSRWSIFKPWPFYLDLSMIFLMKAVILVGHDFGDTCISYAMELFPHRVSKAVCVAAAMLTSGQSTLDMFSQKADSNDLMRQAQIFLYANGNTQPPTAINLDKSLLTDLLFNQSPAKLVLIFAKFHLADCGPRCCPSICVNEANPFRTSFGEALSFEMKYGS